jgi:hypothetical protein
MNISSRLRMYQILIGTLFLNSSICHFETKNDFGITLNEWASLVLTRIPIKHLP